MNHDWVMNVGMKWIEARILINKIRFLPWKKDWGAIYKWLPIKLWKIGWPLVLLVITVIQCNDIRVGSLVVNGKPLSLCANHPRDCNLMQEPEYASWIRFLIATTPFRNQQTHTRSGTILTDILTYASLLASEDDQTAAPRWPGKQRTFDPFLFAKPNPDMSNRETSPVYRSK